jgi:hypothetical protein
VARYYKKWEDHSPRWQREQTRKGLSKNRWNAWLKLSDKTRKATDPSQYASGKSIADQRRERKIQQAVQKVKSANSQAARTSVIQRNVRKMSDKDLDWTLKASPKQIRERASKKHVQGYPTNPWWYR